MCRAIVWCFLAWAGMGCTGNILGGEQSSGAPSDQPPGTVPPGAGDESTDIDVAWPVELTGRASALRRLSRDELITSFRMLVGQAPSRAELPEEQRSGHALLRTNGTAFIASELTKLLPVVRDFAAELAPTLLPQTGCVAVDQAQRDCLLGWSQSLAERTLRRAPRADELDLYRGMLAAANGSSQPDQDALTGVLTAVFFSPSFLYRTELGAPSALGAHPRVLEGSELAAKLSFFATLGPPDAELLATARDGRLNDGQERSRQLQRLLSTADGKRAQSVFVLEWLGANESKVSQKSAPYLEGLDADFSDQARASADAFIDSVLSGPSPSLTQLLTGTSYLTDPVVSQLMQPGSVGGVATGDDALVNRAGLLMHPQVLASHTKENGASPFQLGLFLKETLLCESIGAAPPGAIDMTKEDVPEGLSMRETLEYRTAASPVCSSCHAQFAPLGYSFISFDPLGRWVRQDPSGKPWDLSGNVSTARGEPLAFESPAELLQAVARRPQAQGCFAQRALEWSLGRGLVAADGPLIRALDAQLRATGDSVPAILQTIVSSPEFANVAAVN